MQAISDDSTQPEEPYREEEALKILIIPKKEHSPRISPVIAARRGGERY